MDRVVRFKYNANDTDRGVWPASDLDRIRCKRGTISILVLLLTNIISVVVSAPEQVSYIQLLL